MNANIETYETPAEPEPENDKPAEREVYAPTVRLSHPRSQQVIEVRADMTRNYLAQGWRKATPEAPGPSAKKAEWVAFAVSTGLSEQEAEAMTKAELIAALS